MKNLDLIYKQNPKIAIKKIEKEIFLVPLFRPKEQISIYPKDMYVLNPPAIFIWNCFDGKKNLKEIISRFSKKFEVSLDKSEKHISEFIDYFVKNEFLLVK